MPSVRGSVRPSSPPFDWRRRWQVWGCYQEPVLDGRPWPSRSRLELFAQALTPAQAIDGVPDLVAVMMNPGGSRPLVEPDERGWAPAQPDRTQLQLMKLAEAVTTVAATHAAPVRHLRVLNLSDLRTPQSAELFGWLKDLRDPRHSIFSRVRREECERLLGLETTPILRAWGLSPALTPLALPALEVTQGRLVLGLTDDGLRYRHPLPQHAERQREWLQAVLLQWHQVRAPKAAAQGLPLSSNSAIL